MASEHCPKCEVGVLLVTAEDENGTNARCFNCGWGGTFPKKGKATDPGSRSTESFTAKSGGERTPVPLGPFGEKGGS